MKMKRIIQIILLFIITGNGLRAQNNPMYSQYMFNMLVINPAYAGNTETTNATGIYRNQWTNIDGAPQTISFSMDSPVKKKNLGWGINMMNDKIGVFNNSALMAVMSYKLRFEHSSLSFGMQGGFNYYSANLTSVETMPYGNNQDIAFSQNISRWYPNIGAGMFYAASNYYLGLSFLNMLKDPLNKEITPQTGSNYFRNMFITGGYVFKISNHVVLKPSFLIKYADGAPLQADINCNMWAYEFIGIGISYRSFNAICVLLELKATEHIKIGYAYDQSYTAFQPYSGGSHELMLRYEFKRSNTKVVTPRYF